MTHRLDVDNHHELPKLLQLIRAGKSGWGRALRDIRKMSGLSQQQLANLMKLHRTTIGGWEGEKYRPASVAVVCKVLTEMRVDSRLLDQVFSGGMEGDDRANPHTDSETLKLALAALDAIIESSGDAEERAMYTVQKEIITAQYRKAKAGDARAATFVLSWIEKLIEEKRRQRHSDSANTSASQFRQRPRSEVDESIFEDDSPESASAPGDRRSASEPTVDPPRYDEAFPGPSKENTEPFLHDGEQPPRIIRRHSGRLVRVP